MIVRSVLLKNIKKLFSKSQRQLLNSNSTLNSYLSCEKNLNNRFVWSTGTQASKSDYSLTPNEITQASSIIKDTYNSLNESIRFICITLHEASSNSHSARTAEAVILNSRTGIATELLVNLENSTIVKQKNLKKGIQPMLTPEDCDLAEEIVKTSTKLQEVLLERYNISDMSKVAADPWSVHLASKEDIQLTIPSDPDLPPPRLVQTFLYQRMYGSELQDNHYAHPIDILPIVDLNTQTLVKINGLDRVPPPKIPSKSINYHRDLLRTNSYLATTWRDKTLKALDIIQPDGPSFDVSDGNLVTWQNWSFRVGFNYREGLVLHDVKFDDRSVLNRASLVEMAVPYADPHPPFTRKCAFDVGDYGLGNCANSLELGCDCLGHIHYFDAYLNSVDGEPKLLKKAICMHEEDDGILWKHVEYRNGHNEARRARELVLSSIATVVNYEYLFYWRFKLDGTIDFEIRLSGELSTNLVSDGENETKPKYGTLVGEGINAQIHQHMFCARLDMAVDGIKNTVSEIDILPEESSSEINSIGNVFIPHETTLKKEQDAVRLYDATKARSWKISNAQNVLNPITNKPTSYKLIPFTRGPAQPPLLTHSQSNVSKKGNFAKAHLWVTKNSPTQRFPAGEYTPQLQELYDGLPSWIQQNRNIEAEDVVLWHAFGVTHVPRVEDFPVMPCESTGFTLKPDGFFTGNPAIDLPPEVNQKSKLDGGDGDDKNCCS